MLTVVHDAESANGSDADACRLLLDEIVRDGARQMLAAALKAEVAAYVEQFADQLGFGVLGVEFAEGSLQLT